ncbi:hypothetical protein GCM10027262_74870 [Nocardia tengchongensis]
MGRAVAERDSDRDQVPTRGLTDPTKHHREDELLDRCEYGIGFDSGRIAKGEQAAVLHHHPADTGFAHHTSNTDFAARTVCEDRSAGEQIIPYLQSTMPGRRAGEQTGPRARCGLDEFQGAPGPFGRHSKEVVGQYGRIDVRADRIQLRGRNTDIERGGPDQSSDARGNGAFDHRRTIPTNSNPKTGVVGGFSPLGSGGCDRSTSDLRGRGGVRGQPDGDRMRQRRYRIPFAPPSPRASSKRSSMPVTIL